LICRHCAHFCSSKSGIVYNKFEIAVEKRSRIYGLNWPRFPHKGFVSVADHKEIHRGVIKMEEAVEVGIYGVKVKG
jgi:hypothetical protein